MDYCCHIHTGDHAICGLVGVAGDTTSNWKDVFTDLLIVDSLRGAHSTGVAAVKRFQSEVSLVKQPGNPYNLIHSAEYRTALTSVVKCLIGHNRYATIGEHTIENAHPFAFPHIVGAHNGTLDKSSIKELYGNEYCGTDSEAIYSNINQNGLKDTVDKLRGAWALTWYNTKDNTVNFLRNDKRPLYYAYSKDRCTIVWASEKDMLEFVLKRARNETLGGEFYQVDADHHFSWEIPDSITKKIGVPRKEKMEGPPPLPVTTYYYGGGGSNGRWENGAWISNHRPTRSVLDDNVLPFPTTGGMKCTAFDRRIITSGFRPPYKDEKGKILNKKEFHRITANGCVFCGNNLIDWGDFIQPLRSADSKDIFLCEDCYNDEDIFEICSALI